MFLIKPLILNGLALSGMRIGCAFEELWSGRMIDWLSIWDEIREEVGAAVVLIMLIFVVLVLLVVTGVLQGTVL